MPRAVLFESQSLQLVNVTFVSYFKSPFHSKVKILLLVVNIQMCLTVSYSKEMKARPETCRFFNCHRNLLFSGETGVLVCVSICNKDFSRFIKNETFFPPTLTDVSVVSISILNLSAVISNVILKPQGKLSAFLLIRITLKNL